MQTTVNKDSFYKKKCTDCPITCRSHTHRKSWEARGLWAGGLHVSRHTIGRTGAVHVDGTGRVGRGKAPPRVGRCRCRRRVWGSGGTESLRRRCCCSLVVVHHCKGNGEVPLVGWRRCISSPRCGPRCRRHWLMRLPSCGRRGPFRDNETTSTQKNSHTIKPPATTQKHNSLLGSLTASWILQFFVAPRCKGAADLIHGVVHSKTS